MNGPNRTRMSVPDLPDSHTIEAMCHADPDRLYLNGPRRSLRSWTRLVIRHELVKRRH
ncbi:hypothetical protein BN2475_190148 [Paraburkholderia ribeironis]|uniref:Uncharacterized protein n=1 Tax=Paraburkholderia ribeironis TaxID=1247936 RepID=A0A1N7RVV9_9BURK|nr:hypothetical protein BN2475_190148 [Paraburkholderia ribeironis]